MNSAIVYFFSAAGLEGVAEGAAAAELLGAATAVAVAVADAAAEV